MPSLSRDPNFTYIIPQQAAKQKPIFLVYHLEFCNFQNGIIISSLITELARKKRIPENSKNYLVMSCPYYVLGGSHQFIFLMCCESVCQQFWFLSHHNQPFMSKNYLLLFLLKKHYLESLKALKFKIGKRRRRKTNKKQLLNDELDSLTVTRKSVTELAENFFCSTVFS